MGTIIASLALWGCAKAVTVVAVGDAMFHGMVQRAAADADHTVNGVSTNHGGYDAVFTEMTAVVSAADIAVVNLESPVAPRTGAPVRPMVFNAPPVVLESLAHTGFDLVGFANNHVYDQGREGFVETLEHLKAGPLTPFGAGLTCAEAQAPLLVDAGRLTIAFLGATDLLNLPLNRGEDQPCVARLSKDAVIASAAEARAAGADAVILFVHWGNEYETKPSLAHVALAKAVIEGGVDVVIGHHPHVAQPVDWVTTADGRKGFVAYSLGNFVSSQSANYASGVHPPGTARPRDGLLLSFDLVARRGRRQTGVTVTRVAVHPLWTMNNAPTRGAGPVEISVVPTLERIEGLDAELAALSRGKQVDEVRVAALMAERAEMVRRFEVVAEVVAPEWLVGP